MDEGPIVLRAVQTQNRRTAPAPSNTKLKTRDNKRGEQKETILVIGNGHRTPAI